MQSRRGNRACLRASRPTAKIAWCQALRRRCLTLVLLSLLAGPPLVAEKAALRVYDSRPGAGELLAADQKHVDVIVHYVLPNGTREGLSYTLVALEGEPRSPAVQSIRFARNGIGIPRAEREGLVGFRVPLAAASPYHPAGQDDGGIELRWIFALLVGTPESRASLMAAATDPLIFRLEGPEEEENDEAPSEEDGLTWRVFSFSGGSGETCDDAIVVHAGDERRGLAAEHFWLREHAPDLRVKKQGYFPGSDGRRFDLIKLGGDGGERRNVCFDITSYYGK